MFPIRRPDGVSVTGGPQCSRSMACRGIAYQPRVPTLGIHPQRQPRVLKERRIGCVPRTSAPNRLLRGRSLAKKTFGAATGVSDPRLQKNRIRNNGAGGYAATVAGYDGPGFHNWPSGHIPQDTAPNPLLRGRSPAQKTFGAATGVSDPRLQKIRINGDCRCHHCVHSANQTRIFWNPCDHPLRNPCLRRRRPERKALGWNPWTLPV